MIELKQVSFSYETGTETLSDINLHITPGERVGIIGANGAGKSTLMKALLGIVMTEGEIYIDRVKVSKKSLSEIRKTLGYVLQNSDNQMFMPTVYEDMLFAPLNYGVEEAEAQKQVDEILQKLEIEHLKQKYNHKLSGGEKRMAAIATILMMQPKVILMDEPTSALDPYNRRLVIRIMNQIPQTKIIASHDLDMIWDTCDRVILLSEGKIVKDATKEEVLSDRELLEKHHLELPLRFSNEE